jgi:hypothetical protein
MTPPTIELRNQWLTSTEIATEYNRTEQQVRSWCRDGTLVAFGFRVCRIGNAWWINNPNPSDAVSRK